MSWNRAGDTPEFLANELAGRDQIAGPADDPAFKQNIQQPAEAHRNGTRAPGELSFAKHDSVERNHSRPARCEGCPRVGAGHLSMHHMGLHIGNSPVQRGHEREMP